MTENLAEKHSNNNFKTNMELVEDLMNYSPYGGLCQVFIIEAIRFYAEQVSKSQPPKPENDTGFISARAWHGIACDILIRLEKRNTKEKLNG